MYNLNEAYFIYSAIVEGKDMTAVENYHQQKRTFSSSSISSWDTRKLLE
jgi:hypothetical protein